MSYLSRSKRDTSSYIALNRTDERIGPGSYNINVSLDLTSKKKNFAPFGSLSARDNMPGGKYNFSVPGPGAYQTVSVDDSSKSPRAWSVFKSTTGRFNYGNKNKTIGEYRLPLIEWSGQSVQKKPLMQLKKNEALRTLSNHLKIPSIPSQGTDGGYTIRQDGTLEPRLDDNRNKLPPGPADYSPSLDFMKPKGCVSFGKPSSGERKAASDTSHIPILTPKVPEVSTKSNERADSPPRPTANFMSRVPRLLLEDHNRAPGPGAYNLGLEWTKPQYSLRFQNFGNRRARFQLVDVGENKVGPGTYSLCTDSIWNRPQLPDTSRAPFGSTSKRFVQLLEPLEEVPRDSTPRSHGCKFRRAPRASKVAFGSTSQRFYSVSEKVSSEAVKEPSHESMPRVRPSSKRRARATAFKARTIPAKYTDSKMQDSTEPGPGSYHPYLPESTNNPCKSVFSKPTKKEKIPENVPGPGSYELRSSLIKASYSTEGTPAFASRSARTTVYDNKQKECLPGPGSYNLPTFSVPPTFNATIRIVDI